jgi:hypothetical protein
MAEHTGVTARGSSPGTTSASTDTHDNGIVGRVREQATTQLNTQKDKATDGLGTVASAVRETTSRLRSENHDTVARYAEQAADQIERFSERIRNKDVGELMHDAQRLARRQPALFVGGAFALGLLGARFMKSSAESNRDYAGSGEYTRGRESAGSWQSLSPSTSGATNAYGNRVPSSAGTASSSSTRTRRSSTANRDRDYPPTEGL